MATQEKIEGKAIVETLAKDLQKEFPGIQRFSFRNLWNMRQFYSAYKDNPKLQIMVGEISWTKNIKLPCELNKYLPTPEEMIKRLEEVG